MSNSDSMMNKLREVAFGFKDEREYRFHRHQQRDRSYQDKYDQAVYFMAGYMSESKVLAEVREAEKKDPKNWWIPYHLTWGMDVRNLLRRNGYGEKELGVENLDDVYVGIVESALYVAD